MKFALMLLGFLASDVVYAAKDFPRVPDQFVGTWAGSPDACGTNADDMTIKISARLITYWESEGVVRAAVVRGNHEIAIISEMSGEGQSWLSSVIFKLSKDGKKLIDSTTVPGEEFIRYKCRENTRKR